MSVLVLLAVAKCANGFICQDTPSGPRCVNETRNVKSGECPVPDRDSVGICADMCQSDKDCERDLKCCRNPCGAYTCQSPVLNKPTCQTTECARDFIWQETPSGPQCVYAIRAGQCPSRPVTKHPRPCSKCRSDLDCPGYQKCCLGSNFFCRQCVDPEPSVTCENTVCPRGQKCIMVKVICAKAPCLPVPRCV